MLGAQGELFCWLSCREKRRLNREGWNGPDLSLLNSVGIYQGHRWNAVRCPVSDMKRQGKHTAIALGCCRSFSRSRKGWTGRLTVLTDHVKPFFFLLAGKWFHECSWLAFCEPEPACVIPHVSQPGFKPNLEKEPKRLANTYFTLRMRVTEKWKYKGWHLSLKGLAINYEVSAKVTALVFYCTVYLISLMLLQVMMCPYPKPDGVLWA